MRLSPIQYAGHRPLTLAVRSPCLILMIRHDDTTSIAIHVHLDARYHFPSHGTYDRWSSAHPTDSPFTTRTPLRRKRSRSMTPPTIFVYDASLNLHTLFATLLLVRFVSAVYGRSSLLASHRRTHKPTDTARDDVNGHIAGEPDWTLWHITFPQTPLSVRSVAISTFWPPARPGGTPLENNVHLGFRSTLNPKGRVSANLAGGMSGLPSAVLRARAAAPPPPELYAPYPHPLPRSIVTTRRSAGRTPDKPRQGGTPPV